MKDKENSSSPRHIPEDIVRKILKRLSTKSLVRFLSVSKDWSRIITDSDFVASHLRDNILQSTHQSLISYHRKLNHFDFRLATKDALHLFPEGLHMGSVEVVHPTGKKNPFEIFGSVDGLICISDKPCTLKSPVYICKPSIRKYLLLPKSLLLTPHFSDDCNLLSFGFCSDRDDYIVVRTVWGKLFGEECVQMEIYSLNRQCWNKIEVCPDILKESVKFIKFIKCGVYKGIVCWLLLHGYEVHLLSLNLGTMDFETLELPNAVMEGGSLLLSRFKDDVCLFHCHTKDKVEHAVDIWVLENSYFRKEHTAVLEGREIVPIGFGLHNELILLGLDTYNEYRLQLYDLESNKMTYTGIRMAEKLFADTYSESLRLINNPNGKGRLSETKRKQKRKLYFLKFQVYSLSFLSSV